MSVPNTKTIGQLKKSGYQSRSVKQEIRENLIDKIDRGDSTFPGIVGFDLTVIPQLENALIAGQDIILLGERGQAKTRILRQLTSLLDEYVPVIEGCDINDDPLSPICHQCIGLIRDKGDSVAIGWLGREKRYSEKLATPDVSVADLVGEIDPIKIAEGRHLSDEDAIHFGMIPRSHRSVFCINELPDLSERIQVSLFNLLQERDIQIKGYQIRLPLDLFLVATANPEDYTNRGRIITPLKDRYGSQIRTHYPSTLAQELQIVNQERRRFEDIEDKVDVPGFMKTLIAMFTQLARRSPEINQRSGVSLRVTISNYETLLAQAFRRSVRQGVKSSPRISDLEFLTASTIGKLELETVEEGKEGEIINGILQRAILNTFNEVMEREQLIKLLESIDDGMTIEVGTDRPDDEYAEAINKVEGMEDLLAKLADSTNISMKVAAFEFILEGLHLNKLINKASNGSEGVYSQK